MKSKTVVVGYYSGIGADIPCCVSPDGKIRAFDTSGAAGQWNVSSEMIIFGRWTQDSFNASDR
jgi:hypothetical protein